MFLTALEYLRGETVEMPDEASTLGSNKLEIAEQLVQDKKCFKEVATPQDAGTAMAGTKALTGSSKKQSKWLIRFKFLGNVSLFVFTAQCLAK